MGRAEPARGSGQVLRRASRAGLGGAAPGGILAQDAGQGDGGEDVGATGGGAAARGHRRVRDALRVELGVGGGFGRGADAVLAAVRRAEVEQGVRGGRDEGRSGH
uniref:Uncharacterized protein n=1 Tax=Arundo donax TaxID=35708 RepID=A0A0A9CS57_ARUDO